VDREPRAADGSGRYGRDFVVADEGRPESPAQRIDIVVVVVTLGSHAPGKEGQAQGNGGHEKGSVAHLKPP
jgi:hypothetical protein